MAKWGEGDQRWIVNDHGGQGRNVGSWHWEEKNRMEWTRERLSQLLEGLYAQPTTDGPAPPAASATIKTVSVKGTAFTTRRKGNKVAAIHDLSLTIDWQATFTKESENAHNNDEGTTANNSNTLEEGIIKGQIIITEFVSGCDVDDAEFSVSVTGSTAAHDAMKTKVAAMKSEIFKLLEQYAVELAALEEEGGGES
jgi:activator of HSP90 ATPase